MIKLQLPKIFQRKPQNKRKKFLFFAVLAIFFLSGVGYLGAKNGWFGGGATIPEDTMTRGLVGYWPMDEGGGTTANDASGNGNNGTLINGPKWTVGKNAGALQFDGKDDYLDAGINSLNVSTTMTLETWVKIPNMGGNGYYGIISKTERTNGWQLLKNYGVGNFLFEIFENGSNSGSVFASPSINANQWTHLVLTIDGVNWKWYSNGVYLASNTASRNLTISATNLYIGKSRASNPNYPGFIDETRIYNRVLSDAEVKYHYNQGGPVGYWKFDEGSGATTKDSSGNNNDGTLAGFTSTDTGTAESGSNTTLTDNDKVWAVNQWNNGTIAITAGTGSGQTRSIASNITNVITVSLAWAINPDATSVYSLTQASAWTDGKYNGALSFDDSNDYVDCGNKTSLVPPGSISIDVWINPSSFPKAGDYNDMVTREYGSSSSDSYAFALNSEAKIVWYIRTASGDKLLYSDKILSISTWYHVVGVYDGSQMNIYINGVLDKNNLNASGNIVFDSHSTLIGADSNNNGVNRAEFFGGEIDEVKIYDYARTADEIRLDYQAGMATHLGPSGKTCNQDPAGCMNQGLVGYWPMDEGGGTTTSDKSGNNNNGTLTNGPKWTTGKNKGALQFDGKDDYVAVGNNNIQGNENKISIEAWFKVNNIATYQWIIGKQVATAGGKSTYPLTLNTSPGGYLQARVYDDVGCSGGVCYTASPIVAKVWYHVIATLDTSLASNNLSLFVNGALVGTTTYTANQNFNADYYRIGKYSSSYFFNGLIDDVRIYSRVLSPEEVRYHYNQGGPVGYWNFDEGSGTIAKDASVNNNDGNLVNGPIWVSGRYGAALIFDGINDYFDVPYNNALNPVKITVSTWVYSSAPSVGHYQVIVARTGAQPYDLLISPTGYLYSELRTSGSNYNARLTGYQVPQNRWVYLAMTYDGVNEKIYSDGNLVDTYAVPNPGDLFKSSDVDFIVGGNWSNYYFQGKIDDTKIYNYARTADDIRKDYQAGVATHLGPSGKTCNQDPAGCMNQGLVGYWDMNEGGGTTAYDKSGNGNNGTLTNDPKWTNGAPMTEGKSALSFDGKDDYVSFTQITTAKTQEGWFYFSQSASSKGYNQPLFNNLYQHKANNYIYINGTNDYFGIAPQTNQWFHLVLVYDPADDSTAKLYINGSAYNITQQSGPHTVSGPSIISNSVLNVAFKGMIDDVRVYDRALSPEEVRYHYNQGGPVGWWKMDEGRGTKAYDQTSNNNDGILGDGTCQPGSGSCPNWDSGKYGSALNFDGVDDYVNCGTGSSLSISGAVTGEAWIKNNDLLQANKYFFTMGAWNSTSQFSPHINPAGTLRVQWGNGASTTNLDFSNYFTSNEWIHLAVVITSTQVLSYKNGELFGVRSNSLNGIQTYQGLQLGRHWNGGNYFNGALDDVRIYNYARTADQIRVDYNAGVATHLK